MMETIGQRIHRLRKEAGLKQSALGQKLGTSGATVSQWESDKHGPDAENLVKLAVALKTTPSYILSGQDKKMDSALVASMLGDSAANLHDQFVKLTPENQLTIMQLAAVLLSNQSQNKPEAQ